MSKLPFITSSSRPKAHGDHHSYRASPLEEWEGGLNIGMSNTVTTAIRSSVRGMAIGNARTNDKADRATVENAIDPRTRMILYKLLSRGELEHIHGCISTGKEANVYYATKSDGQELAIKTYKTSVLEYKDRARYVDGDRRFTNDYCGSNHGKMVKTWTKKEMRNLLWVKAKGIMCPKPYLRREHVLVMEFIGKDGWGAPRLKDANLSLHKQSTDFFKRHGVGVMTIVELFVFIFDASIVDSAVANYLEKVQQKILERGDVSKEDEIADRAFAKDYIAEKLVDVKIMSGKEILNLYYRMIPGLNGNAEFQSDEDEDNVSDSEEISFYESDQDTPLMKKAARKEARKENKKKVKEEKREARKTKLPKVVKKRRIKKSKAPKTR